MEQEKKDAQRRLVEQEKLAIETKKNELREEQKLEKERKIDLQKFIKLEQAELRKERAEKQRQFLEQIKLEKKIDLFRKREELEIKNLEKYVLSQQRESYEEVQQRIDKIKEKYKLIREQKINEAIRERVASLGIKVEETDDKATLLEKERIYKRYTENLKYIKGVKIPAIRSWVSKYIMWVYNLYLDENFPISRDELVKILKDNKIDTRDAFVPINMQQVLIDKYKLFNQDDCPNANYIMKNGFYLPSGNTITNEEIDIVCDQIKKVSK